MTEGHGTAGRDVAESTIASRDRRIRRFYAEADEWQFGGHEEFFTPDVAFRFGNAEPAQGIAAIRALGGQMQTILAGIRHSVVRIVQEPDSGYAAVEVDMRYQHRDGRTLEVPAGVIYHFGDDELVDAYRIYIDTGSFFA